LSDGPDKHKLCVFKPDKLFLGFSFVVFFIPTFGLGLKPLLTDGSATHLGKA
jgi:hypothetical protein